MAQRNKVTALILTAKNKYYKREFSNAGSNNKKKWSIIKTILNISHTEQPIQQINDNNNTLTHPANIANTLGNFFAHTKTIKPQYDKINSFLHQRARQIKNVVPTNDHKIKKVVYSG